MLQLAIAGALMVYVTYAIVRNHTECENHDCANCPFPKCKGCDR